MFYKLLKIECIKKRLSQMALGKTLGISQEVLGSWERCKTSLDLETLVKIAKFFSVSTDYLLEILNNLNEKNKLDMKEIL
ncbi:helix-turn-helix domain-containing protein [Megamonas funiformis]|uniref:helix-turn-helix domain-containing protein n=1 Tax=Megamonas funiformis TaxID=437897 RepID=UPI00351F9EE0